MFVKAALSLTPEKVFSYAMQIWQMSEHIYEDEWKTEARQR